MGHEKFSFRIQKDGTVRIFREGRCVMTLGGPRARKLVGELKGAEDDEVQDRLRRVTGNFKRGNERPGN